MCHSENKSNILVVKEVLHVHWYVNDGIHFFSVDLRGNNRSTACCLALRWLPWILRSPSRMQFPGLITIWQPWTATSGPLERVCWIQMTFSWVKYIHEHLNFFPDLNFKLVLLIFEKTVLKYWAIFIFYIKHHSCPCYFGLVALIKSMQF